MHVRETRLWNQHITGPLLEKPGDVVRWMGAVQAQDYGQATWAIGLRTSGNTATEIDRALEDGSILRTHVLRPTWHFVTPDDIGWLLALTGPRVKAASAGRLRELLLDEVVLGRSKEVLARALEGRTYLTREELGLVLENAGIETSTPQRLVYILMCAELDRLICNGPRKERQFTYALMNERVPSGRVMDRDEAVAELVRRYFTSHGPASLRDFTWWSGLTMNDARRGLAALKDEIASVKVGDRTYWLPEAASLAEELSPRVHLLPAYDEYTVAYADRSDILRPEHSPQSSVVMLGPVVVVDGYVVGRWRRTIRKGSVSIEVSPFTDIGEAEMHGVVEAARRYGQFVGVPAVLS